MDIMAKSFKRKALAHIERRLGQSRRLVLNQAQTQPGRVVHDLRRWSKELRALWRLLRPLTGRKRYVRENFRLRDASRGLSSARDAAVLRDTLMLMLRARRGRRGRSAWFSVSALLEEDLEREGAPQQAPDEAMEAMLTAIRRGRDRLAALELKEDSIDWKKGLERIYRQARRRHREAGATEGAGAEVDAVIHEWRKSVKYLWHALRLLERMKLVHGSGRVAELKQLQSDLGRDHDLAMLRARLEALPVGEGSEEQAALALAIGDLDRAIKRQRLVYRRPENRLISDKPGEWMEKVVKRSPGD